MLLFLTCSRTCKGKATPVTGRGDPQGWETSRLPKFLDSRLTGDSKVVSPTCRPSFTPRRIPSTHFCQRLSRPQVLVRLEGLGQLKNPMTFRLVAFFFYLSRRIGLVSFNYIANGLLCVLVVSILFFCMAKPL
jgi:hypothetical protein